jgi:saccharopine dehydrogenase-like NADP-dependent oxidoreductase
VIILGEKMKILLLGVGLQGKAALHDLARSPDVAQVIAADVNDADLQRYVDQLNSDKVTKCVKFTQ